MGKVLDITKAIERKRLLEENPWLILFEPPFWNNDSPYPYILVDKDD